MDSRPATHEHIHQVRGLLLGVVRDLTERAHDHDRSKLLPPEVETFDAVSVRLSQLDYGSEAYKAALGDMEPALRHHYAHNDHHPEHHGAGVKDMSLIQMTEMLCDWIAAGRRHAPDEDSIEADRERAASSIAANAQRFGYGPEIQHLLLNTVDAILDAEL